MPIIVTGKVREVNVKVDGPRVVVTEGTDLIFDLPWESALVLAKALHIAAKRAEEDAKALEVIEDQALLDHLGIPIGLSNRKDIREEALRRAVDMGGIGSKAIFGTPKITQHSPKGDKE